MKITSSWFTQIFCCTRPEPIPNDQPEHTEEETEPLEPSKIITNQPLKTPKSKDSQVILCCYPEHSKIRDDQVDLCPTLWYREFFRNPDLSPDLDETESTCLKFQRFIWRLCFIFTCLPLCYPCYLTRSLRRRRKHRMRYLKPEGAIKQFSNELNCTIQRQLTKKSVKPNFPPLNVINVNVIIMHTSASNTLHQYLRTSNGPSSLPVRPLINKNSIQFHTLKTSLSFPAKCTTKYRFTIIYSTLQD